MYDSDNQRFVLYLETNDYINEALVFCGNDKVVTNLSLKTRSGKELVANDKRTDEFNVLKCNRNKREGIDYKVVGLCVGVEKYVSFVQFYYEEIDDIRSSDSNSVNVGVNIRKCSDNILINGVYNNT